MGMHEATGVLAEFSEPRWRTLWMIMAMGEMPCTSWL